MEQGIASCYYNYYNDYNHDDGCWRDNHDDDCSYGGILYSGGYRLDGWYCL